MLFALILEKVVLCGVCRDVAEDLPSAIQTVEEIGGLFVDYRVVIYENDSKDLTAQILTDWANRNDKVSVQCENGVSENEIVNHYEMDHEFYPGKPFRPEQIARARNIVLDIAMSEPYCDFPYLIWIDMDFSVPPELDGIIESFATNIEWDAVLAYGVSTRKSFWDWYAFRDATYPIGSELLGNTWWYMQKSFRLHRKSPWHPVYSAFGGLGIYKKSSIAGCRYSALPTRDLETVAQELVATSRQNIATTELVTIPAPLPNLPKILDPNIGIILHPDLLNPLVWRMSSFVYQYPSVCEHVPFHASMIANGHGKIFINPRMIFYYGKSLFN